MDRDILIDYILNFMPLIHKKIIKRSHGCKMSRQQMWLLFTIKNHNGKPMKYYCEKLMISKPNLTTVSNKLIEEGLLERKTDNNDRRIINLYITEKGIEFLDEHMKTVKEDMSKRLEVLNDEDVKTLNKNFQEIKSIFSKLD